MNEKMTNAKSIMDDNRATIAELIPQFNAAAVKGDLKTMAKLGDEMDNCEGKYNESAKVYAFEELSEQAPKSDEIMKYAAKKLRYDCIRVIEKKDAQTKILSRSLSEVTRPIDPLELEKYVNLPIAPDKEWRYEVERFNFRLTLRIAKKLGMSDAEIKKISDSYSMNKLNDEYRKAELKQLDAKGNAVPNPVSNSQMVNEMQKIVDMCLGEGYKVTSHDVTFFEVCYGKKDNKTGLKVTASTHKQVRMTFMDIMKNIMEYSDKKHSGYSIGYKAKKEEDKTPSEEDKKTFTPTGNTATTEPKPQEEPTLKLAEEPKPEEPKTEEVKPEEPKVEEVKTEEPKPEEKPKRGRGKKEKKEI